MDILNNRVSVTKLFLALLGLLILVGFIAPKQASAITDNPKYIPDSFKNFYVGFENCDGLNPNGRRHAQYQWISPGGDLNNSSTDGRVDVKRGVNTVDLRYHSAGAHCNKALDSAGNIKLKDLSNTIAYFDTNPLSIDRAGLTVTSNSIVSGGRNVLDYSCSNEHNLRYVKLCEGTNPIDRRNVSKPTSNNPFTISGLNSISADTITVKVTARARYVNYFPGQAGVKYFCVAGAYKTNSNGTGTGNRSGSNDSNLRACSVTSVTKAVTITFIPAVVEFGFANLGNCDRISGWAYDGDVPKQPVAMTVIADYPINGGPGTVIVQGKGANLPNSYVNSHWPQSGNSPHGFDIDISSFTYSYNNPKRKFYVYFTDYSYTGKDIGDRKLATVEINTAGCAADNFALNPTAQVNLDDDESPTKATFSSIGVSKVRNSVKNVTITRKYFIEKPGLAPIDITPNPASVTTNISTTEDYAFLGTPQEIAVTGLNVGDQVCVTVTVSPFKGKYNTATGVWVSPNTTTKTAKSCDRFKNKPYVSFYGGDVSVGGAFTGSGDCDLKANISTYSRSGSGGSGGQLATFALGSVITDPTKDISFNSARLRTVEPKPPKGLTFASDGTNNGEFGADHCIPDYFGQKVDTAKLVNSVDLSSTPNGSYRIQPNSGTQYNLSGKIPNGKRLNLFIEGDLRITGNGISYETPTTWGADLSKIPSLHVFVQGHIYIDPTVSTVTGMFVAQPIGILKGTIFTCANGTTTFEPGERLTNCGTKLTINGSLVAKEILLHRAFGSLRNATAESSSGSSNAAEVFNFSPEHFLVSPDSYSGSSDPVQFDAYSVLPPIL